jgi:hypothetical protein
MYVCIKNLSMYVWCGLSSYIHTIREREEEREKRNRLCIYECDERSEAKMCVCCVTKKEKKLEFLLWKKNKWKEENDFFSCTRSLVIFFYLMSWYLPSQFLSYSIATNHFKCLILTITMTCYNLKIEEKT